MENVYVADVGDGLCVCLSTIAGETVQIDCGSQQGSKVAFEGWRRCYYHYFDDSSVFILSHFHIDHYNGLLYASITDNYPPFNIREVYYPGIPEFKEKREFMYALLTVNLRVFGNETGVMEYDFLKAISRITQRPFKYRPLFKGDKINLNGSIFEVLWPPRIIEDNNTLAIIRNALEDFKKALDEDENMKELYDKVSKEGIYDKIKEGGIYEGGFYNRKSYNQSDRKESRKRTLPDVVKKANNSLRKAANHLSLSLFEDNRFLFLGDTEEFEIKQIVDDLKSKGRKRFYLFITPHHGTHWHDSLKEIECIYSVSSNGRKLYSKMKFQFKEISKRSFATSVNGNIVIPQAIPYHLWRILWWFYDKM